MKVNVALSVPDQALAGVADAARLSEQAGVDGISASETSSDPLLQLTVAAGATERVELFSNIVVAFARSPMTLAVQGRAIQEYSNGRLTLGLGSQIKPHIERRFSMPWSAPAARMTEYISALRAIWHAWETGEKLNFRGEFYQHSLMTPMFTPVSHFPAPRVLLAAVGDLMTEAAGRAADGLVVHPFSTARYLREVTLPALERGRAVAGVDRDFEVVGSAFVITGDNDDQLEESKAAVRERVAFYGSTPSYRPVFELHGWGELGDELNVLSKSARPDKWKQMAQLVDDDVLSEFAVTGTPESMGPQLLSRYGALIDRYEVNATGIADSDIERRVAGSVKAAVVSIPV